MNAEELRRLSKAATPGRWGSFGMSLYAGTTGDVDTSTLIADFYTNIDGHPRTLDLDLAVALVNLYRSNQLQVIERDRLARATEIIEDIAICFDENDDSQPLLDYLPTELSDRIAAFLNGSALDSTTGDPE